MKERLSDLVERWRFANEGSGVGRRCADELEAAIEPIEQAQPLTDGFDEWFKQVCLPTDSVDAMRFAWLASRDRMAQQAQPYHGHEESVELTHVDPVPIGNNRICDICGKLWEDHGNDV